MWVFGENFEYWTSSENSDKQHFVWTVSDNDKIYGYNWSIYDGVYVVVRPVITIKKSSLN